MQLDCRTCLRDHDDQCVGCKFFWQRTGCFIMVLCALTVIYGLYGIVTHLLGVGAWNWPNLFKLFQPTNCLF